MMDASSAQDAVRHLYPAAAAANASTVSFCIRRLRYLKVNRKQAGRTDERTDKSSKSWFVRPGKGMKLTVRLGFHDSCCPVYPRGSSGDIFLGRCVIVTARPGDVVCASRQQYWDVRPPLTGGPRCEQTPPPSHVTSPASTACHGPSPLSPSHPTHTPWPLSPFSVIYPPFTPFSPLLPLSHTPTDGGAV